MHLPSRLHTVLLILFGSALIALPASATPLGETLGESGWNRLLGTWVDAETEGERVKTEYEWQFDGEVLRTTSWTPERSSIGLMGTNANTGKIFHMGADDRGASSLGTWTFTEEEAVLDLVFTSEDGEEGVLRFRLRWAGEALAVTIDGPEPVTFELVRAD